MLDINKEINSSDNKKAVIIRANLMDRETRATKIIKTLSNNGFNVTLLCWDRGIKAPRSEKKETGSNYRELPLRFKAPWGVKVIFYLPVWWTYVFFQLMINNWDIAHAIQIISIPPVVLAGKLKKKPVIYDMLDTYEDSILLPKFLRDLFVKIDKIFMKQVSCVVLADEAQIVEVDGIPNSRVVPIYDSPQDIKLTHDKYKESDVVTIFFAGLLYSGKYLNLDKLFKAVEHIEGIEITIAGYGDLVDKINEWSKRMPKQIIYIGEITHAEVIKRSSNADILVMLRDSILPVNKYICGSKILEAMMCGRPIIVNKGTSTANIVVKEKCGLVVDAHNIEEIRNAILKLKNNPELRSMLGQNGREAYEERYSWSIMEKRILAIYNELIE